MNGSYAIPVSQAAPEVRAGFIRRTYVHLALAILAFAAFEYLLLTSPLAPLMASAMTKGMSWLIVLGAYMFVSYIADKWARKPGSVAMQYAGLGLYIVAFGIISVPMLYIAAIKFPGVITMAAIITLLIFGGLTFTAFTCGTDFTFMGGFLRIGGFAALGLIGTSILFGFQLPMMLFSGVMIGFASCCVLYSTSGVLKHYHADQHVAASLSLFSSIGLLFWYVVQFLMSLSGD